MSDTVNNVHYNFTYKKIMSDNTMYKVVQDEIDMRGIACLY